MLSQGDPRARSWPRSGSIPQRRTALLPSLKLAQHEVGWLPPEAIAEVADLVGVSHAAANELATFYSMLNTHHPVDVQGRGLRPASVRARAAPTACWTSSRTAWGSQPGETTPDGKIELHRTARVLRLVQQARRCAA